jgi:hypothetical protein
VINPFGPANGTEGAMTNMGSITEGLPENPNMDSFGEIGEPTGKGNFDIHAETFNAPQPDNPSEKRPGKEDSGKLRRTKPKKKDSTKIA